MEPTQSILALTQPPLLGVRPGIEPQKKEAFSGTRQENSKVRSLGWKGEFFSFFSFGVQAANQVSVASTVPVPVAREERKKGDKVKFRFNCLQNGSKLPKK
ncbi:hypothetical protein AgCh_012573 [Apium graveolens]